MKFGYLNGTCMYSIEELHVIFFSVKTRFKILCLHIMQINYNMVQLRPKITGIIRKHKCIRDYNEDYFTFHPGIRFIFCKTVPAATIREETTFLFPHTKDNTIRRHSKHTFIYICYLRSRLCKLFQIPGSFSNSK